MIYLVLLFVGVLLGLGLARVFGATGTRGKALQETPSERPSQAPALPPPAPPTEQIAADAPLSARLQALVRPVDQAVEDSAHPSDLESNEAFRQAVALLALPTTPLETTLQYAAGTNMGLICAAYAAAAERADGATIVPRLYANTRNVGGWALHFVLKALAKHDPRAPAGRALLGAREHWTGHAIVASLVRDHLAAAIARGAPVGFGDGLEREPQVDRASLRKLLGIVDHPAARTLLVQLDEFEAHAVNRPLLEGLGRLWDVDTESELLIDLPQTQDAIALVELAVRGATPRPVLVVGESRTGKSALLRLAAKRLAPEGFLVFEASGADLQAGQQYIGQLEERVRVLLRELDARRGVIWYVPDLLQLVTAGTHQGQTAGILDQILPAITAGNLLIVSEATPAAYTRLLQVRPRLRALLQVARMPALSPDEIGAATHALGATLAAKLALGIDAAVIDNALQLARQYLGGQQTLGGVLDFLKLACGRAVAGDEPALTRSRLLDTLSQATGLPISVLDDGEKMDLADVRRFFGSRVIGQTAATDAIVERIAMLKAGLTDPSRPTAVFLFAGPTGTGKTELAKTLAEYLFGTEERMIRLDMSEFQSPESTRKILGEPGAAAANESDALTQRVRKQPFCVVLLDEFEKAHANVWDLFLQVFDDGRLTDAAGITVDFRHAFIILTTNLGATSHQSAGLGFVPGASVFADDQILRAVKQSFRPEFVNRLDRVIVFQPLSRDRMREILQKELRRVLQRRGLAAREWAVEWESSAIEFLLDRGFSPDMGARPLRRAIDQHLLAPLAATLVEHRFPEGEQFLFVRSDGRSLQVEFVDPDAEEDDARRALTQAPAGTAVPFDLGSVIMSPEGSAREREALDARLGALRARLESPDWERVRDELNRAMQAAGFWERNDRFATLARYALVDRVRAAADTAAALQARLERSVRGDAHSRPLAARLALQIFLCEQGAADAIEGALADVLVVVSAALDGTYDAGESERWCAQIVEMYRGWAKLRNMQWSDARVAGATVLIVSGFGAARTLHGEAGLHVLDRDRADGAGRAAARVKIALDPLIGPVSDAQRERARRDALDASPPRSEVVRRYRLGAAPLVRDSGSGARTGRADAVLGGQFDIIASMSAE